MFSLRVWGWGGRGQRQWSALGFPISPCGHWGLNPGWQVCGKRLPLLSHLASEHRYLNERMRLSESLAIEVARRKSSESPHWRLRSNAIFLVGTPSLLWHGGKMGQIQGKTSYVCGYSDGRLGQHWHSWWWQPRVEGVPVQRDPQIPPLCLGFGAEFNALLFVLYSKRTNYIIVRFIDLPVFIFTMKFSSWIMCLERWATS